jgi:hypothetical protein
LIDDAGFGNPSAFGGPIATPTMTRVAEEGARFNRFHVTALCSPAVRLGDHRVDVVLGQAGLAGRAGDALAGCSYGVRQRLGVAAAAAPRPVSACRL